MLQTLTKAFYQLAGFKYFIARRNSKKPLKQSISIKRCCDAFNNSFIFDSDRGVKHLIKTILTTTVYQSFHHTKKKRVGFTNAHHASYM